MRNSGINLIKSRVITVLLFLYLLNPITVDAESGELKKVTCLPHWIPQAQFAGLYVAKDLGIYEKYGLDVTIITGGFDHPGIEYLKQGKVDFVTLFLSAAIQERSKGLKLINVAQTSQRSAQVLVAKKTSGISEPADLDGK